MPSSEQKTQRETKQSNNQMHTRNSAEKTMIGRKKEKKKQVTKYLAPKTPPAYPLSSPTFSVTPVPSTCIPAIRFQRSIPQAACRCLLSDSRAVPLSRPCSRLLTRYSRSQNVVPWCSLIDSTLYSTVVVVRNGGGGACSPVLLTLDSLSLATLKTGCKCQGAGMSKTQALSPAMLRIVNGLAFGC